MGSGVGAVIDSSTSLLSSLGVQSSVTAIVHRVIIFFIFLWIISIVWVAKDILARTNATGLQVASILLVTFLTPVLGLPLYHIIRPVSLKKDLIPWREANALNLVACVNCRTLNPKEYDCCMACGEKLKIHCKECNHQYPLTYAYCPMC